MAFTLIQSTDQANGISPITPTFTNTPAVGNLMLCSVLDVSSTTTPTVSDTNGSWLLLNSVKPGTSRSLYLFGRKAVASQPTIVTVSQGANTMFANLYEFSNNFAADNGNASSFIDNNQNNSNSNSGNVTSTLGSEPSVTSTNPNDLLFVQTGWNGIVTSPNWITSGGNTVNALQSNVAGGIRLFDGYAIETAIGTFIPRTTWTTGHGTASLATLLLPAPIFDSSILINQANNCASNF